jgi:hypothetical protein
LHHPVVRLSVTQDFDIMVVVVVVAEGGGRINIEEIVLHLVKRK